MREGEREKVVTDIARYSQKYNQGGYREEGMGERGRGLVTDIARYSQKYNQGGTGKKAWVREGERERVVTDIARYSQK